MRLDEYLSQPGVVAKELARQLNIPAPLLSQWRSGRQVPAERCPSIEKATNGIVTCEELRPDVDWAYLRGRDRRSRTDRRKPKCGGRREEDQA